MKENVDEINKLLENISYLNWLKNKYKTWHNLFKNYISGLNAWHKNKINKNRVDGFTGKFYQTFNVHIILSCSPFL